MEQPLSQLLLKDLKMAPSFETAFFKSLESLGGGTKVPPPLNWIPLPINALIQNVLSSLNPEALIC